ncbi:MAG: DUF5615 family PIN-like protein [Verrucomicrobiota bacterium]|nr:DUF5615 family PIN-like protein [Verrucomicrobiota bacterium]
MSLLLYMDVHVPLAITRGLRRRGVEVLTAQQDSTTEFSDSKLLDRAIQLGRILFTQDQDLLAETVKRLRAGKTFAKVIFARQMEVSIGQCVADLELVAKAGGPEESTNQIVYLPLYKPLLQRSH